MTPEEQKLSEAFWKCYKDMQNSSNYTWEDLAMNVAKSEAAKEYHTKGMHSEEDLVNLGNSYEEYCLNCFGTLPMSFNEWFEQIIKK